MIRFLFFLALIPFPLFAERYSIDPSSRTFEMRPCVKERVDVFDFAGCYPELKKIDIEARKKKNVEFILTGDYPTLETVTYEGSFGVLKGKLTGNFPLLDRMQFLCSQCAMDLDLTSQWQKSCVIRIKGADEKIVVTLPANVGLVVHTKTALKGKVLPREDLIKKNRFGVCNKTFENSLAETAPIVLTLYIEAGDGCISLR
jgi:hypothetical protein